MWLIVGNNKNDILLHERYQHSYPMDNMSVTRYINIDDLTNLEEIHEHFISENWVGFDCHSVVSFQPNQQASKGDTSPQKKKPTYMQMFLDMYMKIRKPKPNAIKNKNEADKSKEAIRKETIQKRDDNAQLHKQTHEAKATPKQQTKIKNTVYSPSPSKVTRNILKKSPNKTPDKNQGTISQWFKIVQEAEDNVQDPNVTLQTLAAQGDECLVVNDEKQKDDENSVKKPVDLHSSSKNVKANNVAANLSKVELPSSTCSPNKQNLDKEIEEYEEPSTSFTPVVDIDPTKKSVNAKKDIADKELSTKLDLDSLSHPSLVSVQRKYTQSSGIPADSAKPCSSTKASVGGMRSLATKRKLNKQTVFGFHLRVVYVTENCGTPLVFLEYHYQRRASKTH
ncbi:unnamed protein product [Callosobruchus maculatus]|nr:unnamed protein product [Callosobruchus maculatus]